MTASSLHTALLGSKKDNEIPVLREKTPHLEVED